MFVFSPLVGTPLTTSAKFAVVAKSPLTGRLTDALASSHLSPDIMCEVFVLSPTDLVDEHELPPREHPASH
jgi:hypothetical protein